MDEQEFSIALAQAKTELTEANKALIVDFPNPSDRVEVLKTIFNRARDICRVNNKGTDKEEKATLKQIGFIKDLLRGHSKKYPNLQAEMLKEYEVEKIEDLSMEQASGAIERLKEKK